MTPIEALYQRARTMQFEKQLSDGRSPFALARRRNKASRDSIHLTTEISALPASSEDDAPRRSTVAGLEGDRIAAEAINAGKPFPKATFAGK